MQGYKSYSWASHIVGALLVTLFLPFYNVGAGEMGAPSLPFSKSKRKLQLTSLIVTSITIQSSEVSAGR
jgi:hypothetical protein